MTGRSRDIRARHRKAGPLPHRGGEADGQARPGGRLRRARRGRLGPRSLLRPQKNAPIRAFAPEKTPRAPWAAGALPYSGRRPEKPRGVQRGSAWFQMRFSPPRRIGCRLICAAAPVGHPTDHQVGAVYHTPVAGGKGGLVVDGGFADLHRIVVVEVCLRLIAALGRPIGEHRRVGAVFKAEIRRRDCRAEEARRSNSLFLPTRNSTYASSCKNEGGWPRSTAAGRTVGRKEPGTRKSRRCRERSQRK